MGDSAIESEIKKTHELACSLRRIFFLQQLLIFNLDDLKDLSGCPQGMKPEIGKIKIAMIQFKNGILKMGGAKMTKIVSTFLSTDAMHDLNLIMEQLNDIENLEEVYKWLVELTDEAKKTEQNATATT